MKDEQIQEMVSKFLGWKLPDNFTPDCGISFSPYHRGINGLVPNRPSGTNLFDANQAEAMIRYITGSPKGE